MKLLYAEDESSMSEAVADVLHYHKYTVDVVDNGQDALDYARTGQYDGILLDIMLPKRSGLDVLRTLRKEGCKLPILLLTARAEIEDRIEGLDSGADDYLPKPFAMGELLARVRAMLRRREEFTPNLLSFGNICLDQKSFEISCGDKHILLPKNEYQIMELLMLNQGIYLSTEDILVKIWGYDTDTDLNTVWVYISYLRRRLEFLGANIVIKARRNIGYTLEVIK